MNKLLRHLLQRMQDNLAPRHLCHVHGNTSGFMPDGTMTMHDKELGHNEHGHEQVGVRGRKFNNALTCPSTAYVSCMSNPSRSQGGQTVSLLLASCGTLCEAPLFGSMQLCGALTQIRTILNTQLQQPFLKWYVRREEVARELQAYNDAITDVALRSEMSVRICMYQQVWSVASESIISEKRHRHSAA